MNDTYAKTVTLGAVGWEDKLSAIHHDAIIVYKDATIYHLLRNYVKDYFIVLESNTFALFIRKDVYAKIKKPAIIPTSKPEFYKKILWTNHINWEKR